MSEFPGGSSTSAPALIAWISTWVARNLGLDGQTIDINRSFVGLGLDSVHAMMLVGDLEEHLSRRLSPTLAWDHSTVAAMAAFLAVDSAPGDQGPGAHDALLSQIDDLPEDELDRLLRERLNGRDPE